VSALRFDLEEQATPSEHSASDEEEEALKRAVAEIFSEEVLEGAAISSDATIEGAAISSDATSSSFLEICSCGYHTCSMIFLYGHPIPVFKSDIEPLFPQSRRDQRALELKGDKS
jgi:hypothetical protein